MNARSGSDDGAEAGDPGPAAAHLERDAEGFLPLAGYAVLGDGRTTAAVGVDGRVDWWAIPTLDSPPVCSALIDPERGGYLSLRPAGPGPCRSSHRYLERTNVLETVHRTGTGTVRVLDSLNTGTAGRLPWTELARRVEGLEGTVDMVWEFVPGDRLRRARPWVAERLGRPVVSLEDQVMTVVTDAAGESLIAADGVRGRFRLSGGDRSLVAVVATDAEPLFVPSAEAISERLDRTIESWRRWSDMVGAQGPYAEAVHRSALALKLLLTENTGAIAAAATTSLPERIGGPKNWDYRYSWVRDSSFTLAAFVRLGLHEEVHGAVSWLLDAIRTNGGDLHVFYRLDGTVADRCREVDVPGYRHSQPVRAGNSAAGQVQLGTYGDLFDTVRLYTEEGHLIDRGTGRMLEDLAERCCERWLDTDSGIWELADCQHYTISKIGCWVALDRAARLARAGQIPDGRAERWESVAAEIHAWVDGHCWSEAKGSYTFYAGTEDLDAAVLLAGRTGFDRGERLSRTIDAVRRELARGPLVYRYTGMDKEEGAFVACSFWLADAMVYAGRIDEARQLMDEAVGLVNEAGLLSEEIDPETGEFLGNLPQGLSHLALINTAFALHKEAKGR